VAANMGQGFDWVYDLLSSNNVVPGDTVVRPVPMMFNVIFLLIMSSYGASVL